MASEVNAYSGLDRFLHKLAFASPKIQLAAADIEDSIFAKQTAGTSDRNPVFVTSLPRAGTTVLLTALASLPGMASQTYRDMPFVMAPLFWSKISGSFQKGSELRERAHGDGIKVGYDSPEAFEEIIWRAFWPKKFTDDRIDLWRDGDSLNEAAVFFRKHFRKVSALRRGGSARYVSKNNANIARLELIPKMFPDAKIVVPVRDPVEHAASLLRQHNNFLAQHAEDAFVKRYMHDIGHLEFGELHRPIAFPGLAERLAGQDPKSLDYWLHYWIAAFEYVAEHQSGLILVSHEAMRSDGASMAERLLRALDIDGAGQLQEVAAHFEPQSGRARLYPDHDASLRSEADALYQRLVSAGI